ncbi:MAG TPA: hypothetical protein VGN88_00625, partial [Phycisphaerae bacterium]
MNRFLRGLALGAILATATQAAAQFAPLTGGGMAEPPAPAETIPAGSMPAAPSIAPMPGGMVDLAPPGGGTANLSNDGPLTTARPNQPMTTNALIGFVNDEPIFLNDLFRPIDDKLRRAATTAKSLNEFKALALPIIRGQLSSMVSEILVVSTAKGQLSEQDRHIIDIQLKLDETNLITQHGGSN